MTGKMTGSSLFFAASGGDEQEKRQKQWEAYQKAEEERKEKNRLWEEQLKKAYDQENWNAYIDSLYDDIKYDCIRASEDGKTEFTRHLSFYPMRRDPSAKETIAYNKLIHDLVPRIFHANTQEGFKSLLISPPGNLGFVSIDDFEERNSAKLFERCQKYVPRLAKATYTNEDADEIIRVLSSRGEQDGLDMRFYKIPIQRGVPEYQFGLKSIFRSYTFKRIEEWCYTVNVLVSWR